MYLGDYHTHSGYSFDGKEPVEAMCLAAISAGISEIAITDHMDIYSGKPYSYILDMPRLYEDIMKCCKKFEDRLTVRFGIELGQPMRNPEEANSFIEDYPDLDFIIGSVHNMSGDIDVGCYDYSACDPYKVCDDYFDELIRFAENYDYDVIGHITYPLRYMAEYGITIDLSRFYDKFEHIFKSVISRGRGIECNVSGYRQKLSDSMPSAALMKMYRDCGGEIVTVGSDAHIADHIGMGIQRGYECLKECGFSYVTGFCARKPYFIKL